MYIYIYIYTHTEFIYLETVTAASVKKTLLRRRRPLRVLARKTPNRGGGEEFPPLSSRAKVRVKGMLFVRRHRY